MGTEEQTADGGGTATASDSLTITDNRTGQTYEVPIEDGTDPRDRAARHQGRRGRLRRHDLRPGVHEHGVVSLGDHVPRRRGRRPRVPRLSDRAARRAARPTSRWPTCSSTASCPTQQQLDEWTHQITIHTFVHENIKSFMQGFRYDAHPMGMLLASVGALSTFYPDANADPRRGDALPADHPADRQDADAGGVRLPPQHGAAVRLSGQRPALPRQLPLDAVQDDRAQVRARSPARAGARRPVHPPRRPRAELLDQRGARGRLLAGRPVLGRRGRHRRALRPAARRRQRGRCCGCCAGSRPRRTSRTSSRA